MLILLAPSEAKAAPPPDAAPVDLEALACPQLAPQRAELAERLARLVAGPPATALRALGLGPRQADELDRDRDLLSAPAAPAADVYTGVLYQHLDLVTLTPAARRRAVEAAPGSGSATPGVLVASALWGVVALGDRIPAYRLSIGARLPRIANLAAWWRAPLAAALPDDELVVDLRSAAYAAAWMPRAAPVVQVGAFTEAPDGGRRPVSHMAKAVRGEVARLLLAGRARPREPQGVAAAVERAGERVELTPPAREGAPWRLDVIRAAGA